MKPSDLIEDLSGKTRIKEKQVNKVLNDYYFYYYPEYPLSSLDHISGASENYIPDATVRNYYINIDYRLIDYREYENTVIKSIVDDYNFLITSFDSKGIQSPMNLFLGDNIHPGKKRLWGARYLQLDTIPIVLQHNYPVDGQHRITTIDELFSIYGNNVSMNVTNEGRLEVSWHGETNRRDANGYDNWYTTSATRKGNFPICDYLLENGLEVVSKFVRHREMTNGSFKTIYTNTPTNDVYIEVYDQRLLNGEFDFWELYYHIDPEIGSKMCETNQLRIVNKRSTAELENCSLYKTLTRRKLKFD